MKTKKTKKINPDVVALVVIRAQGYCEVCGGSAEESMALHHRKLRSRGGEHSVSNLIWVHHGCHNLNTYSIHANPAYATSKGWMVGSCQDPSEVPFCRPDGTLVLLQNEGGVSVLMEGD